MPPSPSRRRRRLLKALSWIAALFGAACLALTAAAMVLGARPLVVKTGSMAPELPVGTVAIVRPQPAASAAPGEVVAIRRSDGKRIMHRVVSARAAGADSVMLVLRGDRNRRADPPVTVTKLERPVVVLPWLGKPIALADGPWAQYWLGVLTGAFVLAWLSERRRGRSGGAGDATPRGAA